MAAFTNTPCQQNSSITLEAQQAKIALAAQRVEDLLDGGAIAAVVQSARDELAMLRLEHHPDHWFIDPGSGRETEDGRLRRRAIQACWADCPMRDRLLCLDLGLQEGPTLDYGIYGGYTEKQRQQIVADKAEHDARPASSRPPLQTR